jgi:hypothetical protein
MTKVDIGKLIRGSDEINRQREAIHLVMGGILANLTRLYGKDKTIWQLHREFTAVENSQHGKLILRCPGGHGRFEIVYKALQENEIEIHRSATGKASFDWKLIPTIYALLSELIRTADKAVPEAGIMADAQFLMAQDSKLN